MADFITSPLLTDHITALKSHIKRTRLGPGGLLRGTKDKPEGLSSYVIKGWLGDDPPQVIRKDHLDYVLARYEQAPTMIRLTETKIKKLKAEQERSKTGAIALLKRLDDLPKDLKPAHVQHWLGGRVKYVRENDYQFVLKTWRERPVKPDPNRREYLS